jgi:glycosyltransferase involved in cell wall biosynthesis
MLEPWALNAGKCKKKLALWLYQNNDLSKAACLHATAQLEADNIRKIGFKNPIAVIPNGIEIPEVQLQGRKNRQGKRTLLFLSRIHYKKGIELLIEAWSRLDKSLRNDWHINIAGNGEEAYVASLQQLIKSKNLETEITIIGPRFGSDKVKEYQQADLFVLPTYSENFGIVIAEALAYGVPVITTKGSPWEELNTCNAGWWIEIGVEPLVQTLKKALQISDFERLKMGQNGRKLVEENYSIETVAKRMRQLYEWILMDGEKPEFVYL